MIVREFFAIALGNLWRLKLRSVLTISGVMVGIGALVSMLSFGNGMQKNISGEFEKMGLLRTMQVFSGPVPGEHEGHTGDPDEHGASGESGEPAAPHHPQPPGTSPDSTVRAGSAPPLDHAALRRIAALEGVALVYPQESFDARIVWREKDVPAKVQALPADFTKQRPFGEIHGRFFASDSAGEAVLSRAWLATHRIEPDSILGDSITIRATGSGEVLMGLASSQLTRLGLPTGVIEAVTKVGSVLLPLFFGSNQASTVVVGTTDFESSFGFNTGSVLIPIQTSSRIDHLSFSDPYQLLSMLSSQTQGGWRMLVVTVSDEHIFAGVRGQIEAMGFHVFSFVDQFEQIRKSFLIFDALVGAIGFLALFIASLSIVNTMVMSITERTREIGILKSLGAEEGQIRTLFLIESAAIGLIGSIAGLLLGYGVSRIGAFIIRRIMLSQGGPDVDPFSLSIWIALGAIAFGVLVSLLAGLYPAARAARVDPVEALRQQ
jgi:ABC-type antimicrobial peptide transport system permease subunit